MLVRCWRLARDAPHWLAGGQVSAASPFTGNTPDLVWEDVQRRVKAAQRKQRRASSGSADAGAGGGGADAPLKINGSAYFGLSNIRVRNALETLPGARECMAGGAGQAYIPVEGR